MLSRDRIIDTFNIFENIQDTRYTFYFLPLNTIYSDSYRYAVHCNSSKSVKHKREVINKIDEN